MICECKKCKELTELLSGYCEKCYLKTKGVFRTQYKERPKCRATIMKLLEDRSDLTLFKIAFWYEYDHPPIIASDGLRLQARKMLQEQTSVRKIAKMHTL